MYSGDREGGHEVELETFTAATGGCVCKRLLSPSLCFLFPTSHTTGQEKKRKEKRKEEKRKGKERKEK